MPSFVSRLEESIFAAAWVRNQDLIETGSEEGRRWAYERSERAVELFREAEREAAKRAIPVAHPLRKTTAHE